MPDLKVIKKVGQVDGQKWEAFYLVFKVAGFDWELKLRANDNEKQALEVVAKEHSTNKK